MFSELRNVRKVFILLAPLRSTGISLIMSEFHSFSALNASFTCFLFSICFCFCLPLFPGLCPCPVTGCLLCCVHLFCVKSLIIVPICIPSYICTSLYISDFTLLIIDYPCLILPTCFNNA